MPYMQFYPGDWRRDTQVQMASLATRGVWIEMLCCMWDSPDRGKISGAAENLARLIGCSAAEFSAALAELETLKIANVTVCNGFVTVCNRRMIKEEKARANSTLRVRKHREKRGCNASVTPYISEVRSQKSENNLPDGRLSPEPGDQKSDRSSLTGGQGSRYTGSGRNCPHQEIIALYHRICPELPPVRVWNDQSAANLRSRWKEDHDRQSLDWWESFFANDVRKSPYLMGRVKEFQANLGWIVRPANFAKILNGQYHDREGRNGTAPKPGTHSHRVATAQHDPAAEKLVDY